MLKLWKIAIFVVFQAFTLTKWSYNPFKSFFRYQHDLRTILDTINYSRHACFNKKPLKTTFFWCFFAKNMLKLRKIVIFAVFQAFTLTKWSSKLFQSFFRYQHDLRTIFDTINHSRHAWFNKKPLKTAFFEDFSLKIC